MVLKNFDELIKKLKSSPEKRKMAIAVAADLHTIEAVIDASKSGIVEPLFVGDKNKIKDIFLNMKEEVNEENIFDVLDEQEACKVAVSLVKEGKANFLMKGKVDTKVILKEVVDKEHGIGMGRTMSHFTIFQVPTYHKLLSCVDGGMVPYPTLEQKVDIINNTVEILLKFGYKKPKVGVLACVEKINPKMPETVEADQLKQLNIKGEIKSSIVEGPISYDCAVNKEIADVKGFESEVAGDVDILVAPNIHAANIMGKMFNCSANAKMAGFIVGARCPIVLTSRGSSAEEKYLSILASAAASV